MQRFLFFIDGVSTAVGKLFAWCIVILTGVVCYEVFVRYALGRPTTWAYDMSYIMYGTLFIMAGAYALARNSHVRADIVYRLLSVRAQAGLDLVLYLVFFFPGIIALVYSGYGFARLSWMINEHSTFSPNGPPLYHFKTLIPLAGAFLFLQGLAETIRAIIALRTGAWPRRPHDVEELEAQILAKVQEAPGAQADTEMPEKKTL
ncbi:TRAP transporter small permease subunit [Antarcticirhabdus aurantiaca]|uniref:TRAP transporter small permease subunit n=1 Tax=Antarcticirhabdus aurantiaca TaxID=2606717 RepID=A0ACD4NMF2_9HYPH|nr:TRAP transporter small permease subunit [Antarcticirhabdus aurantiaca]WAJ27887.1 TRAP transporter small permease subunit [Jeongeuplla avenae]